MSAFMKGITIAVLHLLIVLSVGGKFLYDRYHCPRVWVKTGSIDPDMPVRGRYFTLNVEVQAPWWFNSEDTDKNWKNRYWRENIRLSVQDGKLVASPADSYTGLTLTYWPPNSFTRNSQNGLFLDQGIPFFIAEHARVPFRKPGQELWAEVTVPRKGPPRPIQLAIKDGTEWRPLNLH